MGDVLDLFKVLVGKRFPFQLVFSNEYWMVETGKHVFPLQKYRLVYENLLAMGAKKENFLRPRPAPAAAVPLTPAAASTTPSPTTARASASSTTWPSPPARSSRTSSPTGS